MALSHVYAMHASTESHTRLGVGAGVGVDVGVGEGEGVRDACEHREPHAPLRGEAADGGEEGCGGKRVVARRGARGGARPGEGKGEGEGEGEGAGAGAGEGEGEGAGAGEGEGEGEGRGTLGLWRRSTCWAS